MMNLKSILILVGILALSRQSTSSQQAEIKKNHFKTPITQDYTYQGCFLGSGQICHICYYRKISAPGCDTTELPESNNCILYQDFKQDFNGCYLCQPDYAKDHRIIKKKTQEKGLITRTGLKDNGKCVKIDTVIEDCIEHELFDTGTFCVLCKDGFPNPTFRKCSQKKEIENCLWGARKRGKLECFRCKPGYNTSYNGTRCLPQIIRGCMVFNEFKQQCLACDVFDGYSYRPGNQCQFTGVRVKLR